jgi:hypothetical protein
VLAGRGKQVLAGVLLHVVEPARPIHRAMHAIANVRRAVIHDVHDRAAIFVDDVDDAQGPDGADVERLTARSGIEGGAVTVASNSRREGSSSRTL